MPGLNWDPDARLVDGPEKAMIPVEGASTVKTGAMVAPTTEENVAELLESERASTSKDPVAVNAPPAN